MQLAGEAVPSQPFVTASVTESAPAQQASLLAQYKVIRRNGAVVAFQPGKISVAMTKAFLAVTGGHGAASARIREVVSQLTDGVVNALIRRQPAGGTFHIEDVQDQVELDALAADLVALNDKPDDARLAWRFGVGPAITDPGIKLAELRNWLDKQVLR